MDSVVGDEDCLFFPLVQSARTTSHSTLILTAVSVPSTFRIRLELVDGVPFGRGDIDSLLLEY